MAARQPARSPTDVDRLFAECMNGGDLDGVVALYEPTASFLAQSGDAVSGLSAIRVALAGFMAMRPVLRMNVRNRQGDGTWRFVLDDPFGRG